MMPSSGQRRPDSDVDPGVVSLDGDERRIGYPGWRVAGAGGVGVFFASLVVVTFPVLLKPLSLEFAWTREQVSAAFAIAAGVGAVSAAPLGFLLDRVAARRIAAPALAIFGCAFASLAGLTASLGHLYAVFALLGLAGIGASPVAFGRVISSWFSARRGLALALVVTGGALGGVLHPPLAQALVRLLDWRGACLALGLFALLVGAPVVARFAVERPIERVERVRADAATFTSALRSRAFWLLGAGLMCGTMAQNSVVVHLHALLTDRGVGVDRAALAMSAMAFSAVAGRIVTGAVIDRRSASHAGAALMALAALGAFLLSAATSFATAVFGAVLVGFGTGGESDIAPYLVSRYFGLRCFSSLYGVIWFAGGVGGSVGPILMGRAFDLEGTYSTMLLRLAGAALFAALLMLALPRLGSATPDDAA
jgi:MFS family permease